LNKLKHCIPPPNPEVTVPESGLGQAEATNMSSHLSSTTTTTISTEMIINAVIRVSLIVELVNDHRQAEEGPGSGKGKKRLMFSP